jgi:hypothetical protein
MSVTFGPTAPDQTTELWQFLAGAFGLKEVPPVFNAAALQWKYFDPHPWWPEGRSYQLRTQDGIAAHGCVSPVRFAGTGTTIESMQIIDWAAGRSIPSAGLLLYRKCMETSGATLLAIGGSEDTLKIIPQVKWFKPKQDIRTYSRPLRPWRHFGLSKKNQRSVARLGRNLYWRWSPRLPDSRDWRCRPAVAGEEVFTPSGNFIPIVRTRAWLDYLGRCPLIQSELVILEKDGVPAAHALLARAYGVVMVADFAVTGAAAHQDRVSAFAALVRHSAAFPDAAEIMTGSSLDETCRVFQECGLRHRKSSAVYLADPKKQSPAEARLEITPAIGDAFYWFDPRYPFLC